MSKLIQSKVRNVAYPMLFLIMAQQHETRDKIQYAYCYETVIASSRCASELHNIQACYYSGPYCLYWKGVLLRHHTPARMVYLHSLTNKVHESYEIHHLSTAKNYRHTTSRPFWFKTNVFWFTFLSIFSVWSSVSFSKYERKLLRINLYLTYTWSAISELYVT